MASLEHIQFTPHSIEKHGKELHYVLKTNRRVIKDLPQIFWENGRPWKEANLWAMERATAHHSSLKTVAGYMNALLKYARFLESNQIHWYQFPSRKAERCLVLYRGALISMRDEGLISPSTATQYMRSCVIFYKWVSQNGLLNQSLIKWDEKLFFLKYYDETGFERTLTGKSTDLSIPNRKRVGQSLENGLLPVSEKHRDIILDLAAEYATRELELMLALGFFTGMRLGSICDLKITTLERATPDPSALGLYRIALGPGSSPPVHTKFGVTGHVWIPEALKNELLDYSRSLRRIQREAESSAEDKDLIFLTRFGNSYNRRDKNQSSAVNVEMSKLRKEFVKAGFPELKEFHFHQTRCTFGTTLAQLALSTCSDVAIVIAVVSNALLHGPNSEATTFKYIKFVQSIPIKQALSNNFMFAFSGVDMTKRHD